MHVAVDIYFEVFHSFSAEAPSPESHWELLNVVVCDGFIDPENCRLFAMGLGISLKEVDEIFGTGRGYRGVLRMILWAWLNGKGHPPKWERLVEVLRAPVMGGEVGRCCS